MAFSYNAIMLIVLLELLFAFGVGVVCVVFSFNMLRALYTDSSSDISAGHLPHSRGNSGTFYVSGSETDFSSTVFNVDEGEEFDSERVEDGKGFLRAFTQYLHLS